MMKTFTCLAVCILMLLSVGSASATPMFAPFLSVDVNGGQTTVGPTQEDWTGRNVLDGSLAWSFSPSTLNNSYPVSTSIVSSGQVDVALTGVGVTLASRDRMNPPWNGDTNACCHEPLAHVYRDFAYSTRDTNIGFGRHYIEIEFSGLDVGQTYEITTLAYDQSSTGEGEAESAGYMAWSLFNPAQWMDDNIGSGENYQPAINGVNNPVPTKYRAPVSGGWPSNYGGFEAGMYHYSGSLRAKADSNGEIHVYGWADPNSYSAQTISMIGGYEIGLAPEPTSLVLWGLGLIGIGLYGRRRRSA
jgi:hypothetical protein